MIRNARWLAVPLAVALSIWAVPARAEQAKERQASTAPGAGGLNFPNSFQGFSRNRKEPVKIEADKLEVHDRDRYAIFIGNVVVQQGDSVLRCQQLKVFYEGGLLPSQAAKTASTRESAPAPQASQPGDPAMTAQRLRRLEALGGVIVSSKDQKATGDLGIFDMPSNTATITGSVVITQGPNVMRGEKLVVDLNTGNARLEPGKGNARVQGLFVPNAADDKQSARSRAPRQPAK